MRISDWSSDVCSSDLQIAARKLGQVSALHSLPENVIAHRSKKPLESVVPTERSMKWNSNREASRMDRANMQRSEEHTSELQSLMRISYAVFCLKKKNKNIQKNDNSTYVLL